MDQSCNFARTRVCGAPEREAWVYERPRWHGSHQLFSKNTVRFASTLLRNFNLYAHYSLIPV